MSKTYNKIAFVHGRPAPHPIHTKFAQSVGSEFHLVDFKMRWHDVSVPAYKRYLSWVVCALLFPKRKEYKIFMTEGMHFPPAIMKWTGLLNSKNQKVVGMIDDEALYFIYSDFYAASTKKAMLALLHSYDALICHSEMQVELAYKLLGSTSTPKIYKAFNGVSAERLAALGEIQPELDSNRIVFIANGPSDWRGWYKGIDLLLSAFELAAEKIPFLSLQIIGDWDPDFIQREINKHCPNSKGKIEFVGPTKRLQDYLRNAALYVHCGRGEAFGISVIEAMAAAVPAIVSEWTGAKEAVQKASPALVVPLDTRKIAEKIIWYMGLPVVEKKEISKKCRIVVQEYSEKNAIQHFQEVFSTMEVELGLR